MASTTEPGIGSQTQNNSWEPTAPGFTLGTSPSTQRPGRSRMRKSPTAQTPTSASHSFSGTGRSTSESQGPGPSIPAATVNFQVQTEIPPLFTAGSGDSGATPTGIKRTTSRSSGRTPQVKSRGSSSSTSSNGGATHGLHHLPNGVPFASQSSSFSAAAHTAGNGLSKQGSDTWEDIAARFEGLLRPTEPSNPTTASTQAGRIPSQAPPPPTETAPQQQHQAGGAVPTSPSAADQEPVYFSRDTLPGVGTPGSAGKQGRRRRMYTPHATTSSTAGTSTPLSAATSTPLGPSARPSSSTATAPGSTLPQYSPMMWSPQYPVDSTTGAGTAPTSNPQAASQTAANSPFTPMSASSLASDMSTFRTTPMFKAAPAPAPAQPPAAPAATQQPQQAPMNPFAFPVQQSSTGTESAAAWGGGWFSGSLDSNGPSLVAATSANLTPSSSFSHHTAAAGQAAGSGPVPPAAPAQATSGTAPNVAQGGKVSVGGSSSTSSPSNDTIQGKDTYTGRPQSAGTPQPPSSVPQAPPPPQVVFNAMPQPSRPAAPPPQPPPAPQPAFTFSSQPAPAPTHPVPTPSLFTQSAPLFSAGSIPIPAPAANPIPTDTTSTSTSTSQPAPAPVPPPPVTFSASFTAMPSAPSGGPGSAGRHRVRLVKVPGRGVLSSTSNRQAGAAPTSSNAALSSMPNPIFTAGTSHASGPMSSAVPVHTAPTLTPEEVMAQRAEQRAAKAQALKQQGNDLYAAQKYSESETAYSSALEALAEARPSNTDLAVLHSNRAGARLMVGKPVSALRDALRAVQLDPKFFRAVSRVATCHCRMGCFASAAQMLDKTLDKLSPSSSHFQELYKKLQEVNRTREQVDAVSDVLVAAIRGMQSVSGAGNGSNLQAGNGNGNSNGAAADRVKQALFTLEELHPMVVYSEPMSAMRLTALLALGRYSDALSAGNIAYQVPAAVSQAPWRMWLAMQAHYLAGDLQAALSKGSALTQALSTTSCLDPVSVAAAQGEAEGFGGDSQVALKAAGLRLPQLHEVAATATVAQQLLTLKEEGNAAIKASQHQLAIDKYSAALALAPPPAFAAVLHSNRAAAHQGLGSLLDAMADCLRARALDPTYLRALTRLASLLMDVRRPSAALEILQPLSKPGSGVAVSETEKQSLNAQISTAKDASGWQTTPDHYKLLGLERTCSDDEVKKAYRRAALKHHPDKAVSACRFTTAIPIATDPATAAALASPVRGTCPDTPLSAVVRVVGAAVAIETKVKEEAAWLFNLVSQANEELSDKSRRRKVDMLLEVEVAPAYHAPSNIRGGSGMHGVNRPGSMGSSFYQNYDFGSSFGTAFQSRGGFGYGGNTRGGSTSFGSSAASRGTSATAGTGAPGRTASGATWTGSTFGRGATSGGATGSTFRPGGTSNQYRSYKQPNYARHDAGSDEDEAGHY